jgi:predicted HicB family RNase H-like nuclease
MSNVDHYTYRVFWSPEDGENVAVCTEFPGLSHLAKDPKRALAGIRDLVSFVVSDLNKAKKEVPQPLGAQKYSGHLHVRLPPNVHRELAFLAQESGTSLNRVIIDRLSGAFNPAEGPRFARSGPRQVSKMRSKAAAMRPARLAKKKVANVAARTSRAKKARTQA